MKGIVSLGDLALKYLVSASRRRCDSGALKTHVCFSEDDERRLLAEIKRKLKGASSVVMAECGEKIFSRSLREGIRMAVCSAHVPVLGDGRVSSTSCRNKIFASRRALASKVRAWQKEGLVVGFTNGCFDCLHAGHLASFEQARACCDKLVVAINTDASVRKLKGPTRPIQDEVTRALVLANLELVDAVGTFEEDTALPLLKVVRPDVIAKEGYTIDRWPEARWLIAHGGRAVTLKRIDGFSTSAMEQRLRAK